MVNAGTAGASKKPLAKVYACGGYNSMCRSSAFIYINQNRIHIGGTPHCKPCTKPVALI
jgi:hypothetical protein